MISLLAGLIIIHPPVPTYQDREDELITEAVLEAQTVCSEKRKRRCIGAKELEVLVHSLALSGEEYDVDPLWLVAVGTVESRMRPEALGDDGRAHGIYQIHVPTARGHAGRGSPCRAQGKCTSKLLRCRKRGTTQCRSAIGVSTATAAWLFAKYRAKHPGSGATIYNCGGACCVKRNKNGRCRRHAKWTSTVKKYFRVYRRLNQLRHSANWHRPGVRSD